MLEKGGVTLGEELMLAVTVTVEVRAAANRLFKWAGCTFNLVTCGLYSGRRTDQVEAEMALSPNEVGALPSKPGTWANREPHGPR